MNWKKIDPKLSRVIVCHLGNGASITAVKDGESFDTTMGFTPLAGIPMGTRSGDLDPSIIEYLAKVKNMNIEQVLNYLNKNCGMLGLYGKSDNRDILEGIQNGEDRAKLALDIFCSRIASYIGAYYVELGGLDALIFTAGIGENSPETRAAICERLKVLGIELDLDINDIRTDEDLLISNKKSKVKVYRMRTNEELMIALDVKKILGK